VAWVAWQVGRWRAEVARDVAEAEEVLERVLDQEASDDAHGGGEGGGAHALALQRLLVLARRDDEGRRALEARELARLEELDVARDGVLGDARLEPRLPELVAGLVDGHARGEVVDAREHEVDGAAAEGAVRDAPHQVLKVVHRRDVVVVVLNLDIRVDEGERLLRRGHLAQPALVGCVEEPVHVCELDLVIVKDEQFADAAPHEHLGGD